MKEMGLMNEKFAKISSLCNEQQQKKQPLNKMQAGSVTFKKVGNKAMAASSGLKRKKKSFFVTD